MALPSESRTVSVQAKPGPITLDISSTAVLVVDMQNDFASKGGMFDRAGIDISITRAAIGPTAKVLTCMREADIRVVYLKQGHKADLSDVGPPDSPHRLRHQAVGTQVVAPDGRESRVLIRDTWNTDIVSELTPHPGDTVIYKTRYSGFYGTDLNSVLKQHATKWLVVTGATTSICVESTIRDAMFRDYSCLLLADCTGEPIGHEFQRSNYEASLLTIQKLFGWVSTSTEVIQAFKDRPGGRHRGGGRGQAVNRRAFLGALSGGLLAAPLAAEAQQGKVARIGVLYPGGSAPLAPRMEAFRQGLRESGYVEGSNIAVEIRHADGKVDRLAKLAGDLVQREVSVIATSGDLATRVVQQATTTIPIVAFTDDLVGAGLVASHARPGGNTTGISILSPELDVKRLEALKEVSPGNPRLAVLWDPATGTAQLRAMEVAARSFALQLRVLEVRGSNDLEGAFQTASRERTGALNVLGSPLLASYSQKIVNLAAKNRLPAIYQWREHAEAGGLMSYGPGLRETWRQTGLLVGKVLSGAKPADLPIQQPTKYELVINLKTAKALGLTIPPSLLQRADQVIE